LPDEDAVEIYFRHRTGIESYTLYSDHVDGARNTRPMGSSRTARRH